MLHHPRPVVCLALVPPPVLHPRAADVDVGDDVAVHRHVLTDQEALRLGEGETVQRPGHPRGGAAPRRALQGDGRARLEGLRIPEERENVQ